MGPSDNRAILWHPDIGYDLLCIRMAHARTKRRRRLAARHLGARTALTTLSLVAGLAASPAAAAPPDPRIENQPVITHTRASEHPQWGPRLAPVTIEFFFDLENRYHGSTYRTLKKFAQRHPTRLRVVFRVIKVRKVTPWLAQAVLEAFGHGRFFPFVDAWYAERRPSRQTLPDIARRAKVPMTAIEDAWHNDRHLGTILANESYRRRHGRSTSRIRSTVLINGIEAQTLLPRRKSPNQMRIDDWENAYDRAYERAKRLLARGVPLAALHAALLLQAAAQSPSPQPRPGLIDGRLSRRRQTYKPAKASPRLLTTPEQVRGREDAPVLIIFICSFQSRNCAIMNSTLNTVREIYAPHVRIAFRHLYRTGDPTQPTPALVHNAALCAGKQGAFWKYYDVAFQTTRRSYPTRPATPERLKREAEQLGLGVEEFMQCVKTSTKRGEASKRSARTRRDGARHTPSFVIGGRLYSGTKSLEDLFSLVRDQLRPGVLQQFSRFGTVYE